MDNKMDKNKENNNIVIKFTNVEKEYKLYKSDKHHFLGTFIKSIPYQKKLANNNISFEIKKGESVAILGRNGAGKSTLLKLMTQVTSPSEGSIEVNGQISALLELSSGFEADFTGRENIYLKGMLMGLSKEQINKIEKEVVDFAELGEYIDQSVRTYSSGMRARLGFSICINIMPDILVVDEALSVGDKQFKDKCVKKVKSIIEKDDVTLILVTHSSSMAEEFCKRGMVLNKGKLIYDGPIEEAIVEYDKI